MGGKDCHKSKTALKQVQRLSMVEAALSPQQLLSQGELGLSRLALECRTCLASGQALSEDAVKRMAMCFTALVARGKLDHLSRAEMVGCFRIFREAAGQQHGRGCRKGQTDISALLDTCKQAAKIHYGALPSKLGAGRSETPAPGRSPLSSPSPPPPTKRHRSDIKSKQAQLGRSMLPGKTRASPPFASHAPNQMPLSCGPMLMCSLGTCGTCSGLLLGHVSSITCNQCSQGNSAAEVMRMAHAAQGGHRFASQSSILSSPSSRGSSSFLDRVHDEHSHGEGQSEQGSQHNDEEAHSEKGSLDTNAGELTSPCDSPEIMRGSRTSSRSEVFQADVPAHYGDRMALAVRVMTALKTKLSDKPALLDSLLGVIHSVIGNQIEVPDARLQIEGLLSDTSHSELLADTLLFLPISSETSSGLKAQATDNEETHFGPEYDDYDEEVPDKHGRDGPEAVSGEGGGDRRYKRRPFAGYEIENLVNGVKRFGFGKWAKILAAFKFDDRTAVNLKDAYRVIERRRWKETKTELRLATPSKQGGVLDPTPPSTRGKGTQRRPLLPR